MQPNRPTTHPLPGPGLHRAAGLAVLVAVAVGIAFRLHTSSDLWLDEALSANIAALPVGDLLEQLRRDGHPPLYYLLLHGWMQVFGEGDIAVRALSGLFGVATLPLLWLAAKRYGGRTTATTGVVLLATSPYAVRYATETRMYALVMLLVVAGWLALRAALDRSTPARLLFVALLSGVLALTHYWSLYLLAAIGLLLLVRWRRGSGESLRVLLALVAGGILFLPWLPSFLDQAGSTGTPWGEPERPLNLVAIMFSDFGGGPNGEAQTLGVALVLLCVLALFGRAIDRMRIELDLRTHPHARPEVLAVLGTIAIAVVAGYASGSAFASRYAAVVFPLVILLAALGASRFGDVRVRAGVLVALALLGLLGSYRNLRTDRTQGGEIGAYITEHGAPGDVVAFCPDQLGPSTMRHVPDDRIGMAFPLGTDPRLVDWVGYAERQEEADPAAFAAMVDERAGDDNTVWLVWAPEYRTLEGTCESAVRELQELRRGGTPVVASGDALEHAWLYQYGPDPGR